MAKKLQGFHDLWVNTVTLGDALDQTINSTSDMGQLQQSTNATEIGAAASVTGTLATSITRTGSLFRIDFTLTAVQISVTDAGVSGSYGSTKLFDFVAGAISFLGCRQDYTAFAEGAALTGAAGDAAFEIGLGTAAIASAADGVLDDGTQENIGAAIAVTLSGGTGTGTAVDGAKTTALNGTGTAVDLNLNWAGTAATIDANSTITVTGTITVVGVMLGDD